MLLLLGTGDVTAGSGGCWGVDADDARCATLCFCCAALSRPCRPPRALPPCEQQSTTNNARMTAEESKHASWSQGFNGAYAAGSACNNLSQYVVHRL
jgi:hypothetical protein